ncbi:hypothetical protein [Blastococcus sp. SYSU DS0619]
MLKTTRAAGRAPDGPPTDGRSAAMRRVAQGRRAAPPWSDARWVLVLSLLGAGLCVVNVVPIYPGFMSWDTIQQLGQALGARPLDDWHPPVMTAVWWLTMALSGGSVGGMLVLQLALLWGSLTLLAVYVFQRTGRVLLALLPLLVGTVPYVASISGVIWKDAQFAFAMLLAVVLLLHVRRGISRVWLRNLTVAAALVLLAYAGAVRYNALPALVPVLALLTWPSAGGSRRRRVVLAGGTLLASLVATPVIDAVRPVQETSPAASIMVDDVLHLYSVDELRAAPVDAPLRDYLLRLATSCPPSGFDVNYTWRCANTTGTIPAPFLTHADQLRELYLRGVAERPLRYAEFRLRVFGDFLDTPPEQVFVSWYGILENPYGVEFSPNAATQLLESYDSFTARNFGFVYRPFFWLLAALAVVGVAWRRRREWAHAGVALALGASAAVYVVTYLPIVIGYDYRYVYWSAIAVTLAALLLLVDRTGARKKADGPGASVGGTSPPDSTAPLDLGLERHGRPPVTADAGGPGSSSVASRR